MSRPGWPEWKFTTSQQDWNQWELVSEFYIGFSNLKVRSNFCFEKKGLFLSGEENMMNINTTVE
jgi:hypothetical protein